MKPTFLNRRRDSRMLLPAKIRLTMKLTFLILFAACLQVSASSYAQKITLSEKNASLEKIFRVIKAQTGYLFLFDDQQLQSARKVTIEVKEASIQAVLDQCFLDQPLAYRIVDKTIIVQPKIIIKNGPPFVIRGVVTDDEDHPFDHVTVQVEGK